VLHYAADVTALTRLEGLLVRNCDVALRVDPGVSLRGLVLDSCVFEQFGLSGGAGVEIELSSGGTDEQVVVEGCVFAGAGTGTTPLALDFLVQSGTVVNAGRLQGNRVTGGCASGFRVTVRDTAETDPDFAIIENVFEGYTVAGLRLEVFGGGGVPSNMARLDGRVEANRMSGSGGTERGLDLYAERGQSALEGASLECEIGFNDIGTNWINVFSSTNNNTAQQVDIVCDFYGNTIRDAGRSGVEFQSVGPLIGLANNSPDFGPGNVVDRAGANTFRGNGVDFRLDLATGTISARNNFWTAGNPTVTGGLIDAANPLAATLFASLSSSVVSSTGGDLTLTAASNSRLVDYPGEGARGQMTAIIGGTVLTQDLITAPRPGTLAVLTLPALPLGTTTLTLIAPGGQTGSATLTVGAGTGGSGGTGGAEEGSGCFVATAAHGDYDAPEVYELRRLRDQYLQTTGTGRAFISWYYEDGPTAATWIAERPWARSTARAALAAPVALSQALNDWNPGQRFAAAALLLGLACAVRRRRA
jgi:hypothetical protein